MADYVPNIGEERMMQLILQAGTLYVGLMGNSRTNLVALGEAVVFADITPITNLSPSNEIAITGGSWTIPTGGSSGNPATNTARVFTAGSGGASGGVSGYYVRDGSNNLLWLGMHPDVDGGGALKSMPEGATYTVNLSFDGE